MYMQVDEQYISMKHTDCSFTAMEQNNIYDRTKGRNHKTWMKMCFFSTFKYL